MKKIFLLLLLTISATYIFAQVNFNNQVLVYFKTGAQRVAPANTTSNITSQNILNVLNTYSIPASNVVPSFPSFNEADTVMSETGESSRQMNRAKVFTITVTNPGTIANLITDLNNLAEVLYAESNGSASTDIIPIDGRFGQQWGMRNTVVPGADIHLDGATNIFTGNANSIIAIIDNGVDRVHNDLDAKILGGDNGFQIGLDNLGRQFSHGTHVAGIAAAISNNNNNNGVAGVDWAARIHPKNIFDGNGDPDITQSIIDAVNFNTNVWTFNNSWGLTRGLDQFGLPIPGRYSVTVRSAFAQAYRNNRVQCVAMGNHQVYSGGIYANVVSFPAGFNSGIIAVGATDIGDNIGNFAAHGAHIDVSAPGVGIWSTNFNNNYIDLSGTSMATPHVAGLASLLKGFNTNLANDDIEQIIRLSTDDLFPVGFDNASGTGRINAERALQFLQAPNIVQQLSVTGGTVFSTSGNMTRIFLGVPGLADAAYIVRRSEVRTIVTFPAMCNIVGVWGRGVGTTGYREENGRNFGEGICEVVPGTLTNTGCTLRTWVYEVWSASGQYIGFRPVTPANVVFQYTILGVPAPSQINGEDIFCTISNNYSIANLPVGATVLWQEQPGGVVTINSPNSSQTTLTSIGNGIITLTATISNACGGQIILTKQNIVVGTPIPIGINGPNHDLCYNGRTSEIAWFYVVDPINSLTYYWQIDGQGAGIGSSVRVDAFRWDVGNHQIRVRSYSSACGYSAWYTSSFIVIDCSSNRFTISPNPSSDNIYVTVNNLAKSISKQIEVREVELIDKMGNIRHKKKLGNGFTSANISVSNLPNDIYTLRIFDGEVWHSYKISIQH